MRGALHIPYPLTHLPHRNDRGGGGEYLWDSACGRGYKDPLLYGGEGGGEEDAASVEGDIFGGMPGTTLSIPHDSAKSKPITGGGGGVSSQMRGGAGGRLSGGGLGRGTSGSYDRQPQFHGPIRGDMYFSPSLQGGKGIHLPRAFHLHKTPNLCVLLNRGPTILLSSFVSGGGGGAWYGGGSLTTGN